MSGERALYRPTGECWSTKEFLGAKLIRGRTRSGPLSAEELLFADRIFADDVVEARHDWLEWSDSIAPWAMLLLEAGRSMPPLVGRPAYRFDVHTGQFVNLESGEPVSLEQLQALVDARIVESTRRIRELSDAFVIGGEPRDIAAWERQFLRELRRLHIELAVLGIGGFAQVLTWQKVEEKLASELGFLSDFASDIEAGFMSDVMIAYRASLYPKAARQEFWIGVQLASMQAGYRFERRVAVGDKNTCSECTYLDSLGWQPIGTLPPPPQRCLGLNNCRCTMEFS